MIAEYPAQEYTHFLLPRVSLLSMPVFVEEELQNV